MTPEEEKEAGELSVKYRGRMIPYKEYLRIRNDGELKLRRIERGIKEEIDRFEATGQPRDDWDSGVVSASDVRRIMAEQEIKDQKRLGSDLRGPVSDEEVEEHLAKVDAQERKEFIDAIVNSLIERNYSLYDSLWKRGENEFEKPITEEEVSAEVSRRSQELDERNKQLGY